jgi:hypothetical protein
METAREGLAMASISELLKGLLQKDQVWAKGRIVANFDPSVWRLDSFGSAMKYSEYGLTSTNGWEIDHIDPDGPDELWNLQPLYWLNNRRKSDKTPSTLFSDFLKIVSKK